MTRQQAATIARERLSSWGNRLAGRTATPAALVGVGHDPAAPGEVHLLVTEDMALADLAVFLEFALRDVRARIDRGEQ